MIAGLLGFGGEMVGTAVGAVMGYVGSVVEGLALIAARVVDLLPEATDLGLEIPGGWLLGYSMVNSFLPLSEALAFVVVLVGIQAVALLARLAVVTYHLIPKPFVGT